MKGVIDKCSIIPSFLGTILFLSGCNPLYEPLPIYGISLDPCATGLQSISDNGAAAFDRG